ncbi:MAG: carboxymuconolactone decarboxylase family protein [Acidobacteria bacterium]|nr:carboxymuconolactone decarboxylase family protein [Acidobacteriota bacterium]MBI3657952.1 carboxymuconolactone decarboxylase family protein [Acidobacteriota bacterium]
MPRYLPVQKDAATTAVKDSYEVIEKDFGGMIPNLFRTLAPSSTFLSAWLVTYRTLVGGECALHDRLRALLLLKVSKVNKDAYSVAHFTDLAKKNGITDDQIKAIDTHDRSELFTDDEKMLMSYAELVAKDPSQITGDFFKFLKNHFTQQQIIELTAMAAFATALNRFAKALDIEIDKR